MKQSLKTCLLLGEGVCERSKQTEVLRLGESGAQPSVIACGDASSLTGSI